MKKQCQECGRAKKGEPLYKWDDKILCVFCLAAKAVETGHNIENCGYAGEEETNV